MASRKEYEMLFALEAQLGREFRTTFAKARGELGDTADSAESFGSRATQAVDAVSSVLAAAGISAALKEIKEGFACGDADAAELKRAVLQCTDRVIMLMDSQKIGLSSTFSFAALDQIDVVVTDEQVPKEFRKACADKQIELY